MSKTQQVLLNHLKRIANLMIALINTIPMSNLFIKIPHFKKECFLMYIEGKPSWKDIIL